MSEKPHPAWPRRLLTSLRLACAVGLLVWALHQVNLHEVAAIRWTTSSTGWMALAFAFGGTAVLGLATRWWLYLRIYDLRPTFAEVWRLTLFADFFNLYFLGPIGADGLRLLLLGRRYPGKGGAILGSLFIDHIGGFIGAAIIYVIFTHRTGALPPATQSAIDGALAIFVMFCLLGLGVLMHTRVQGFIVSRDVPFISKALAPLFASDPYRRHWLLAGQLAATVGITCGFLAFWAAARATGSPVSPALMLGLMPLVDTVASLPITVSGLGVRENLIVELLGRQQHFGPGKALAASLLGFAAIGIWGLIGGLWLTLWRRHERSKTASP